MAKQIELLVEAFPERKRLGVLWDVQSADQFAVAEREAKARQLSVAGDQNGKSALRFRPGVSSAGAGRRADAAVSCGAPPSGGKTRRSCALPSSIGCRAYSILKHFVEAGGLMSYGVDFGPMMRRAASFTAKILRGAKPADLPVEQATQFEFVVNLKSARAIGVTLPTSILLRADEVIE